MEKDQKILEEIREQNKKIMEYMVQQNQSTNELKNEVTNRFNRLESAVLETSLNVKSLTVKVEKIDQKIDTAVTNHESRIRKLEQKVGV